MRKYLLRNVYNKVNSRKLRVLAIKTLDSLNIPIYRIGLDTNNICNLKCIMCYMSLPDYKQKREIMPLRLFETIAQQIFKKVTLLDMSCGFEPFMTKRFIDYVRIARKYCKGYIGACTNGLLLDEAKVNSIVSEGLLDEINISCDGLTETTYNSIRGKGNFSTLLPVFDLINKNKQELKVNKPVVRMNYTMMKRNIEELEHAFDFVKRYNIDILQLRHVRFTKPFSALFNESLFYHQKLSDTIINKIINDFKKDRSRQLIHPPLFTSSTNVVTNKSACAYPWFNFTISSDGTVKMCNIGSIGNCNEQSFQEILQSEQVRNIYRNLMKGKYEKLCENCITVSDMGSVKERTTFIREDLQPDRL